MRTLSFAALAPLALAFSVQAAPVNLVVNGGFEANAVSSGSWVNVGTMAGWTQVGGPGRGFEIRNNAVGSAHGGHNFIELDTTGNTTIEQVFAGLTRGALYELSFWYSPRIGQSAATNAIGVYWNGASLTANPITAAGGSANLWTEYRFDVKAISGINSLRFASLGASDSVGGNLDDVSLTAKLPEPASLALSAVALGALGWVRRRRA